MVVKHQKNLKSTEVHTRIKRVPQNGEQLGEHYSDLSRTE